MTNSKEIIIVATLIHLAAIVYGIIKGYWDAVILAVVLLGASLISVSYTHLTLPTTYTV